MALRVVEPGIGARHEVVPDVLGGLLDGFRSSAESQGIKNHRGDSPTLARDSRNSKKLGGMDVQLAPSSRPDWEYSFAQPDDPRLFVKPGFRTGDINRFSAR